MRVAFVTTYDARTPRHWSGTPYAMWHAIEGDGVEVDLVGPLEDRLARVWRTKSSLYRSIRHERYEPERQPWVQRDYARQVRARLERGEHDVVLSPGSIPIARLRTRAPVVFWTDATFAAMVGFNPAFRGLAAETIRDGNAGEQAALDTSALALYASDWAADSARSRYRVDAAKVRVVPFGANLPAEPDPGRVARAIEGRPDGRCDLVFVAVEWENKDGATAVATVAELIRRGIPATLTVVGVQPPPGLPAFVEYAGFLDKRDPAQVARYESLLARSHLLLVPSRAEAFGIVYAAASAYGVPSLARRVGGVPTAVRDGVNGRLLAPDADATAFADIAEELALDPASYRALARSSFEEYRTRLNWAVAGRTVRELLQGLVARG